MLITDPFRIAVIRTILSYLYKGIKDQEYFNNLYGNTTVEFNLPNMFEVMNTIACLINYIELNYMRYFENYKLKNIYIFRENITKDIELQLFSSANFNDHVPEGKEIKNFALLFIEFIEFFLRERRFEDVQNKRVKYRLGHHDTITVWPPR